MNREQIGALIGKMTLEEKAGLCSGANFWNLKGIERFGIPQLLVADGPHGLRKQADDSDHLGLGESKSAVCFPAGCALAASFDREILNLLGETLGDECQAEGVGILLGPAVNIKRSPLCGRNFEYYSEDPLLATEMAGAFIEGLQSRHVGACIKHFLANNQEYRRQTVSAEVDERALREIYMASFEGAVRKHKPWTVMSAYNRVNGVYMSENKRYLTDVLRDEWEFDGFVMTDWGGISERVPGLQAGLDVEMPFSGGENDALIIEAVQSGQIDEQILDVTCERILTTVYHYFDNRDETAVYNLQEDHEIARKIAENCIVLLKNDSGILPLDSRSKIALIGEFAQSPRYQGGGSSHINSSQVTGVLDCVADAADISYACGFGVDQDKTDSDLLEQAIEAARRAEIAIIFAGLPDKLESEAYDRPHMRLPDCQNELIDKVCAVQPNTVVVLHNGSPVEMPWVEKVKGLVEAYLGGQAVGAAVAGVLFGRVNPSGRLPETFPLRLEDNPAYIGFPGDGKTADYREGVFVGYRYYETKAMDVLFPFGHGLSYTTFEYDNLKLDKQTMKDTDVLTVRVDITNSGEMAGKETVQVYVAPRVNKAVRPVRELRAFDKVMLQPGECKTLTFKLGKRDFSYWNTSIHDWFVESGAYCLEVGRSVRDLCVSTSLVVESVQALPEVFTLSSTLGDILRNPRSGAILQPFLGQLSGRDDGAANESSAVSSNMIDASVDGMTLRSLISFVPGVTRDSINQLLSALNG